MVPQIAGVVILYNTVLKDLEYNIKSYIYELDKLYVIDNSDIPPSLELLEFIDSFNKIDYTYLNGNQGIATALNIGAQKAIKEGYEWLLTMDQDSSMYPETINKMYTFITKNKSIHFIGILAARPNTPTRKKIKNIEWEFKNSVITSGNLVNLNAYKNIGGFEDKLFIDVVDIVFCLSLRKLGYKIIQLNNLVFKHQLGASKIRYFCGIRMIPTHHNATRKYYIMRNRCYLYQKFIMVFPSFILCDIIERLKELIKLIIFEDQKLKKIKYSFWGIKDCLNKKFGKCRY